MADLRLNLQKKEIDFGQLRSGLTATMNQNPTFDKFKTNLRQHFEEETRVRMQIQDCEKRIDEVGFEMLR